MGRSFTQGEVYPNAQGALRAAGRPEAGQGSGSET